MVPPDPLVLNVELLMKTSRSAKKGSAGGPSGMTVEHLRPLLESGVCGEVATQFARGQVPEQVLFAVRLGRMTAVQKPDGGVQGVVGGNVFRRLVGRTRQTIRRASVGATHPPVRFFHSGMLHTLCRRSPVLIQVQQSFPIDDVGANDLIS